MKSKTVISALIFICFQQICLGQDLSEWYAYSVAEKTNPNAHASLAASLLDAPAGKHGFVESKGRDFIFSDGTPAKFWGTNLCFEACFPAKEEAQALAERLAFFGFNAVRLHHMDYTSEPKGIFSDQKDKSTVTLSPEQLDRLDYLIYELKENGIYVDINLLVSRHFSENDGVKNANRLKLAAKPVSFFDPKLIQLQRKYAKDLLTHVNPYTKLRLCDDPAVAMIEIINESSIFDAWKWNQLNPNAWGLKRGMVPDTYLSQLDKRWRGWLRLKYGGVQKNMMRVSFGMGAASQDTKQFYSYITSLYFHRMLKFLKNDLGVKCAVTGIGGYSQPDDADAEAAVDFFDKHVYWDHPDFSDRNWDKNNFKITGSSALKDSRLGMVGALKDLARHEKPVTITEWDHCYPNRYAYESPVLMAAYAVKNGWDALFQFTYADGWEQKPDFNRINGYFDLIANPQKLILCSVAGIFYRRAEKIEVHADTTKGRAIFLGTSAAGVSGSIKDETFDFGFAQLKASQNGSVFLYSKDAQNLNHSKEIILIALSEVKNSGSGWVGRHYRWGTSPTLLKKIGVQVHLKTSEKRRLFALNNYGMRVDEIPTTYSDGAITFNTEKSNTPWFVIVSDEIPG